MSPNNVDIDSPAPVRTVNTQPKASLEMHPMNPNSVHVQGTTVSPESGNKADLAARIRGGGAAKDCFIACISCFICFECCEGCCDCIADIICCPCEMCC